MRFLPYILKHLRRNWLRTSSTILAMAVCVFLFCTLQTILEAVNWGLRSANASRLVTRHAVSLVFNMPNAYKARIQSIDGVRRVATTNWFFGFLGATPDFTTFFPNFAVDAEDYLAIYPEYLITDDERDAFLRDRRGCLVGHETAARFGWQVGDTFQLESTIPPYRTGRPFEFVIRGIYRTDEARYPGTDARLMLFHYEYLDEATSGRAGAGTFAVEIDDPGRAAAVAAAIDARFQNSDAQTRTETESAFRAGFVSLSGNLALLLNLISTTVAFTILLVTANTMSMAVRERRTEIGVLKTLGFSSRLVLGLVLGEAILIALAGGFLGLVMSRSIIHALPSLPFIGDAVRGFPSLGLSPPVAALGFGVALALGVGAGLVPAVSAYRARITEMLRTV